MNIKSRLKTAKLQAELFRTTWQARARANVQPGYVYNPRLNRPIYGEQHTRWVENVDKAGLRFVGFADELLTLKHTGHLTRWDDYMGEALRGAVYRLPARHGIERFAYGYNDPDNDGAAFLSFDPCDNTDDAARWADHVAECAAEEQREENAKFDAEQEIESALEEIATLRAEVLDVIRECKQTCGIFSAEAFPAIRKSALAYISEHIERRADLYARIADLRERWGIV